MIFTLAHFIVWPSSVTLTFNLSEQMIQMSNCIKSFRNPCINVHVIARTSSIYDLFIIWPSGVTLTFNRPEKMFHMALLLLKEKNFAKLFWNPCINVQVMARTISVWSLETNVSNSTSSPRGQQLSQVILKSMHKCTSYSPDNPNGRTHVARTHTHRTEVVTTTYMSCSPQAGSTKKYLETELNPKPNDSFSFPDIVFVCLCWW